jgi:hypothetical protein
MNSVEALSGKWCVFIKPHYGGGQVHDAVKIHRVEEIGVRFGGVPYIRFQADHDRTRVIEILGAWSIMGDSRDNA